MKLTSVAVALSLLIFGTTTISSAETTAPASGMNNFFPAAAMEAKLKESGDKIVISPGESTDSQSTSGKAAKSPADKEPIVIRMAEPPTTGSETDQDAARARRIKEHQARIMTILNQRRAEREQQRANDAGTTGAVTRPNSEMTTDAAARREQRILQHEARIREILHRSSERPVRQTQDQ